MSSSRTDAALVDVVMPQMGTSMSEGTVVAWSKQLGDPVVADETLLEISTDKIDTECPAPVSGTLVEILVDVGETVDVGTVLARISTSSGQAGLRAGPVVDRGGPAGRPAAPSPITTTGSAGGAAARSPSSLPADSSTAAAPAAGANGRRYSPVVSRIAAEHGVDLAQVPGTGRGGRVRKQDVLAWIEQGHGVAEAPEERPLHSESPYRPDPVEPASAAPALDDLGGVVQPLSRMRRSIGEHMKRSLELAATCTTVVECDMSQVERRRRELGLTALPLIARAAIDTLRDFPELNATLDGATLTRYERVHLGIAVSLGADGLIVPVIHDAQELAPEGLGERIKELARRARAKQLTPDEVQGATFTITNPGMYGALIATPVINQPQVAILDLEAIVKRPVVVADAEGNDAIAIRPMVNLCMSWDHRVLDGAYAAQFLTALRARLEQA